MSAIANFPLIEISGTPQARGRAYGEAARQRIRASIDLYTGQMSKLNFNLADLPRLTANLISKIEGRAASASASQSPAPSSTGRFSSSLMNPCSVRDMTVQGHILILWQTCRSSSTLPPVRLPRSRRSRAGG